MKLLILINIEDELTSKGKLVDGVSPIKITMEQATGKCKIFLKPYYAIDFTKENSIRNILEFDSVISNDPVEQRNAEIGAPNTHSD